MGTINIYNSKNEVLAASEFIHSNLASSYVGCKGDTSYYNVGGIIWEIWQFGMGNYPMSNGVKACGFSA